MHANEFPPAGFDPLQKAEMAAKATCRGDHRKYYRFRPAKFYGGIATADCLGCCLRCKFCWSWPKVVSPGRFGRFYAPGQVSAKLTHIALAQGFHHIRISGNEPTIGRVHLIKVLELLPQNLLFILETNGILLGHDPSYAEDLARFANLYVRVSLKGCNEAEFYALSGAASDGFQLQVQALENLVRAGVKTHPAVMISFSTPDTIAGLRKRLRAIDPGFEDIEVEELVLYGDVEERLAKANLSVNYSHPPVYPV
ncbi:MAG: radical SAM protein [Desulfobacterales bacterium]|nr:MAG: radical SAM protein [Desulfobacterales bacterium]